MVTPDPGLLARGACFGYEVRSELALAYLRNGGGDPLEVGVALPPEKARGDLLQEWRPPRSATHVRLYADGDDYQVWIDGAGWFGVEPRVPRVTVSPNGDPVRQEERVWGLPVLLCFLARGDVPLHASCVEVDGRALLMAAPRRFGKTTLATAFAAAGHRVLAEDLTCLRPGPVPAVIPGPAMLRVRRDVAEALDLGHSRELSRDDDRVHLSIETARGTCEPVPVAGLALLNEAETDPRVEGVAGADVVRDLWAVSFNLPTVEDRARCFHAVAELASTIRTWNLSRRLRLDDLRPTVDLLVEAVRDDA